MTQKCAVCDKDTKNVSYECLCKNNIVFENCCDTCSVNLVKKCAECGKEYSFDVKTKFLLTTRRCNYFFDILLGTFTVLCVAFLLAPMDILAATSLKTYLPNQEFHLYYDNPRDSVWMSNLMFPGANIQVVPDIFYVIFISLAYFCMVCGPFSVPMWLSEQTYSKKRLFVPLIIPIAFMFHVLGNVHYHFWCGVGVIPKQNCFIVFTWKSFQMWLSGFIIVAICLGCALGLFFLFKWLFIAKKKEIVVRELSSV